MNYYNESAQAPVLPDTSSKQVGRLISIILSDSTSEMAARMTNPKTGSHYRGYLLAMLAVPASVYRATRIKDEEQLPVTRRPLISPEGFARIYDCFGLIDAKTSRDWLPLHGHVAATTAAAVTIINRTLEANIDLDPRVVVTATLVHDVAKGRELKHGALASSLEYTDHTANGIIRAVMQEEEVAEDTIEKVLISAANTGRQDRAFDAEEARIASIKAKGIEAAIVGLADARTVHMDFLSLEEAQEHYLERKRDAESQHFFTEQWPQYYRAVSAYLTNLAPRLNLDNIDTNTVYQETILPATQGLDA